MKNLVSALAFVFLIFAGIAPTQALAQVSLVSPSAMKPHHGFVRKSPCGAGAGDNCGSNPPTWHITPDQCGTLFSTSSARNEDGSISTKGVRFTLPTVAELTTAGYLGAGASGSAGFTNREGQCELSFVPASPSPQNYLRIGLDGAVLGVDKFTNFWPGASFDFFSGDVIFNTGWGIVRALQNGTSWLSAGTSPSHGDRIGLGQISGHGQGRLFLVTADPTWWTVGSKVGHLAYCPNNGRGVAINSNSHDTLGLMPANCAFEDPGVSTVNYVQILSGSGMAVSAIAAGDAYAAGTAPNGTAYAAGNYVRLTVSSTGGGNLVSGDTLELWNLPTTLGTVINGKWIVKKIDTTHVELHQAVEDWNHEMLVAVGPPSSFVAGDTILGGNSSRVAGAYLGISTVSLAAGRFTEGVNGIEMASTNKDGTIVGIAQGISSVFTDSLTNRQVASYFNQVEKMCQFSPSTDKTTTSTTFVEVDSTRRCTFVYTNGISSKAKALGDAGRGVRYTANVSTSNNTAGNGCEFAFGVDSNTAEETNPPGFVNPTGVSGGRQTVTVTGTKTGLTENTHNLRLLYRAVTGGTCTVYQGGTAAQAWIWQ